MAEIATCAKCGRRIILCVDIKTGKDCAVDFKVDGRDGIEVRNSHVCRARALRGGEAK